MFQRATQLYIAIVVVILGGAIFLRLADPFFVQALRLIAFDSYQKLEPVQYDPDTPVRIVDIDEASLAKIGQWPWSRTIIADILRKLTEQGAAVVVFDILFSEPDRTSPEETIKALPKEQAEMLAPLIANEPTHDQVLAKAVEESPTVLALALGQRANPPVVKAGFAIAGDDPKAFVPAFPGATSNIKELDDAAAGIGAINWLPDRDQVVRRVQLVYRVGDQYVPSLLTEALRVAQQAGTYVLKGSNASGETAFGQDTGLNHIRVGAIEIPTDADGGIWLKFRAANPAAYIPAWKVLSGTDNPDDIAGRIILVGSSAPGLMDLRASPLDPVLPGFEVHAQAIEHILADRGLTRPDYAVALELAITVLLGIALAIVLPRMAALASSALGLSIVVVLVIGAWLAYREFGLLLDPSYPAIVLLILVTTATVYVYRQVEQQRGEVRRAFGYYVAPAVVNEIIAHPDKLELGGEVRELTLLFCDVRNFTSISERLTAHELTRFINSLLTPLSEIILDNRGTIDKYMGDAIMAFWNAPLADADHAANACRSALTMVKRMDVLNEEWKAAAEKEGRPYTRVAIGIGLNSGECCVGNLGSSQRFDYSAIGDNVNVASRLEGLSKVYHVPMVLGESTVQGIPGLRTIELDLMRVKGREHPTRIYTAFDVLGLDEGLYETITQKHTAALGLYRGRDWDGAGAAFDECEKLCGGGLAGLYAVYRGRIAEWRQNPPPADWDGTFTATSK